MKKKTRIPKDVWFEVANMQKQPSIPENAFNYLKPYLKEIDKFYDYCSSFYNNRDGLYKLGASDTAIYWACIERAYFGLKDGSFDGDTFDREQTREIIERDLLTAKN